MSLKSCFLVLAFLSAVEVIAADNKMRDPTRPEVAMKAKAEKNKVVLTISEIRISKNDRQAVINGKRMRTGNSIANYRLQKIEKGYVILRDDKGTLRLNLIKSRINRKKL